jgi:CRISPR system Cascade subunit CasE
VNYISRVDLRRDTAAQRAVVGLLASGGRSDAGHGLIWSLFADDAGAARDFLYRETGPCRYLIVSRRPPNPPGALWSSETKPYAPKFSPGDMLGFRLRANPTRSLRSPGGVRGRRVDATLSGARIGDGDNGGPHARRRLALDWLIERSAALGVQFHLPACRVNALDAAQIGRDAQPPIRFTAAEFEGVLRVVDPPLLEQAMLCGVGRAKAYGCGLLLARPLNPPRSD